MSYLFASALLFASDASGVMNKGGIPYKISNPPGSTANWRGTPGKYSTEFTKNVRGSVEYFDVYGEVQTQYSQVYWTRNDPVPLPPALVERFKGKVMAITGYEVDQVTHTGPEMGPRRSAAAGDALSGFACYPSCDASDKSVPSYNAYNHHYFSWLMSDSAEMYDRDEETLLPNPTRTAVRDLPHDHPYPTNIVFKENPGGEFRKSYHGYPSGYAQLLHSPESWVVEPMQIDTHNRAYGINEQVGYKPSFTPKQDHNNMTQTNSGLSPLIECPCTTRISRSVRNQSQILTTGSCGASVVVSLGDCAAAVAALARVSSSRTISNQSMPSGCIMVPDGKSGDSFTAIFNTIKPTSAAQCGPATPPKALELRGDASLGGLVNMTISHDGTTATLTLAGPAGGWFGVGFAARSMSDLPYAIIVNGDGSVEERKLADHGPGQVLKTTVNLTSSKTNAGVRTVVLKRPVEIADKTYYSFPIIPGDIDVITAVGDTPKIAYHTARTGAKITLISTSAPACVCEPIAHTYLTYMNKTTEEFHYDCADEPRSDMLRRGDGTGRALPNAACAMQSYHGGLRCCKHQFFLTDVEQNGQIPNKTDTYFLKWRYYFQEYKPKTDIAAASHKHLHHWVFLIDERVNDYEEDNAVYGKASIGRIEAHLTGQLMGLEDTPKKFNTITPLVMTPHCHAPSCIREEFWNEDTGEIICNVTAEYGRPEYGPLTAVFNEKDYIAIPPCIFGNQPGLQFPFNLTSATRIRAVKYLNNTYRHLGQMAQWTGLMVYDTDEY